jgi:hypothetical protein
VNAMVFILPMNDEISRVGTPFRSLQPMPWPPGPLSREGRAGPRSLHHMLQPRVPAGVFLTGSAEDGHEAQALEGEEAEGPAGAGHFGVG